MKVRLFVGDMLYLGKLFGIKNLGIYNILLLHTNYFVVGRIKATKNLQSESNLCIHNANMRRATIRIQKVSPHVVRKAN